MAKIYGELERAQLENLVADPAGTGLVAGRIWFNTTSNEYKFYDGSSIVTLGVAGGGGVMAWTKYTVGHAALQAAALSSDIELFSLAAQSAIHAVTMKHTTAFAGTGITKYDVSVGIAGDLNKYASEFDVLQAVGNTVAQASNAFDVENFGAATSIRIAATSLGANLDQSSAGSVDVWVLTSALPA